MKKIKLNLSAIAFHEVLGMSFERTKELAEIVTAIWETDTSRNKTILTHEILERFEPKTEAELLFTGMMIGRITTAMEFGYEVKGGIVTPIEREDKVN